MESARSASWAATQLAVFGPNAEQRLVLVTCFGRYSSSTGIYDQRLVVFSRRVSSGQAPEVVQLRP